MSFGRELVFDKGDCVVSWSNTNAFHNAPVVGSSPTSSTPELAGFCWNTPSRRQSIPGERDLFQRGVSGTRKPVPGGCWEKARRVIWQIKETSRASRVGETTRPARRASG